MIKGLLLGFIPEKDTSHEIKTNYANSRKNECTFMNYNNNFQKRRRDFGDNTQQSNHMK